MEKRAVSPLIATVLLIGITVMISVIVFVFVRTTLEETTSDTEARSNIMLACSQNLKLEYSSPMPCGYGTVLNLSVWNKSPLDIIDFKIQVLSDIDSYLEEGGELTSYNKKLYEIEDLPFDVGSVKKIALIPTISLNEISGTCSSIIIEINQITSC